MLCFWVYNEDISEHLLFVLIDGNNESKKPESEVKKFGKD